jgi:hypothetical protein
MLRHLCSLLAGTLLLAACGSTDEQIQRPPEEQPEPFVNPTPVVEIASPGQLAVGDAMTILGRDFLAPANGKIYMQFKGTFFDSKGGSNPVDLQVTPKVNTTSDKALVKSLSWNMWPNIVFHKNGDQLGHFVGHLVVANAANDGTTQFSDPLPVSIDILPSLIPRMVRPLEKACSGIVKDTLESLGMSFTVEAVGLRAGAKDNPLTFYWTFLAEHWSVSFNYGTMDPGSVVPKQGAFMVQDDLTSGTVSNVQDSGSHNFLIKVGSDMLGTASLKTLKTGTITGDGNNMPISVNVAAVDASGKSAKLSIPLIIHHQADMVYNNESRIAERFPATMVSDCIPGSDIGRDVTYHEGSSESHARSLSFSWNASLGVNVAPIPSNPFALGLNFSAGFGMNIHEQVSSDSSKSLSISGHILAGTYGAFYRQTTKVHRVAHLIGYNECGESFALGDAVLTDWLFTPELATGTTCPPASHLPAAEKFE